MNVWAVIVMLVFRSDADRREFERRFPGMGTTTSEIDSNRCFQINSEPFIDVLCDMTLIEREHDCLKEKLSHSVDTFKLNKSGPKALGSVHLTMDIEALSLLPLVFRYASFQSLFYEL